MKSTRAFMLVLVLFLIGAIGMAAAWTAAPAGDGGEESGQELIVPGGCSGPSGIFCDGFESGTTSAWSPRRCSVPDVDLPVE